LRRRRSNVHTRHLILAGAVVKMVPGTGATLVLLLAGAMGPAASAAGKLRGKLITGRLTLQQICRLLTWQSEAYTTRTTNPPIIRILYDRRTENRIFLRYF